MFKREELNTGPQTFPTFGDDPVHLMDGRPGSSVSEGFSCLRIPDYSAENFKLCHFQRFLRPERPLKVIKHPRFNFSLWHHHAGLVGMSCFHKNSRFLPSILPTVGVVLWKGAFLGPERLEIIDCIWELDLGTCSKTLAKHRKTKHNNWPMNTKEIHVQGETFKSYGKNRMKFKLIEPLFFYPSSKFSLHFLQYGNDTTIYDIFGEKKRVLGLNKSKILKNNKKVFFSSYLFVIARVLIL